MQAHFMKIHKIQNAINQNIINFKSKNKVLKIVII